MKKLLTILALTVSSISFGYKYTVINETGKDIQCFMTMDRGGKTDFYKKIPSNGKFEIKDLACFYKLWVSFDNKKWYTTVDHHIIFCKDTTFTVKHKDNRFVYYAGNKAMKAPVIEHKYYHPKIGEGQKNTDDYEKKQKEKELLQNKDLNCKRNCSRPCKGYYRKGPLKGKCSLRGKKVCKVVCE